MMTIASLHMNEAHLNSRYIPADRQGNPTGLARVYKLSTPKDLDGDGIDDEYVLMRLLYRREHMHAEIALFPCRMGSFPLVPCPKDNPDAIQFAIAVAFSFYDITLEANSGDDS
jgi:hypothetical protein